MAKKHRVLAELTASVNGVNGTPVTVPGALQTGVEELSLGRRKTAHSSMDLYGVVQVARPLTVSEKQSSDSFLATKSGVTL